MTAVFVYPGLLVQPRQRLVTVWYIWRRRVKHRSRRSVSCGFILSAPGSPAKVVAVRRYSYRFQGLELSIVH
ncbi:hypothetical protein QCMSULEJ_CDS0061 [Escherichia phage KS_W4]